MTLLYFLFCLCEGVKEHTRYLGGINNTSDIIIQNLRLLLGNTIDFFYIISNYL